MHQLILTFILSCVCFIHLPPYKRDKLAAQSVKYAFSSSQFEFGLNSGTTTTQPELQPPSPSASKQPTPLQHHFLESSSAQEPFAPSPRLHLLLVIFEEQKRPKKGVSLLPFVKNGTRRDFSPFHLLGPNDRDKSSPPHVPLI